MSLIEEHAAGGRGAAGAEFPRREVYTGLGVAGAFVLALFGWGMWARVDSAVTAQGQVAVSGQRQAVQHREGGVVSELDVHEGDQVRAGQVLLKLNADELQATERAEAAQVVELKALQARLMAELKGAGAVSFPPGLAGADGAERASADAAMALQQREFATRAAALSTEKAVLVTHEQESSEQIQGYQRQIAANREQQRLIREEIDGLVGLQARGLVPATRVRSLQRNAAELGGAEGEYTADIAKSQVEIGESRIRVSDLERERAAEDSKEYQSAEYQLADLEPKLAAVRQQIARTEVRSPATGKVVGLSIFTVGGVVAPGQKLMDIVPEDEPLVLQARIKPTDASELKIGQDVEVRVSAFHDRGMPILHARLTKVSADTLTDEKTGQGYFQVEAVAPASELQVIRARRGPDAGLRPGLPVELVIPLHPRTALQYLTEPLRQVLWTSFREQ